MEAAPVFASTAVSSGLPPIPNSEQARSLSYGHGTLSTSAALVKEASAWIYPLRQEIGRVIVGQNYLIDRLLIALIANGHVLLEGCAPSRRPCRSSSGASSSPRTCSQPTSSAR
jgi:hypothetical protein